MSKEGKWGCKTAQTQLGVFHPPSGEEVGWDSGADRVGVVGVELAPQRKARVLAIHVDHPLA